MHKCHDLHLWIYWLFPFLTSKPPKIPVSLKIWKLHIPATGSGGATAVIFPQEEPSSTFRKCLSLNNLNCPSLFHSDNVFKIVISSGFIYNYHGFLFIEFYYMFVFRYLHVNRKVTDFTDI